MYFYDQYKNELLCKIWADYFVTEKNNDIYSIKKTIFTNEVIKKKIFVSRLKHYTFL